MRLEIKILLATVCIVGATIYQFTDWISSELKPRYREAVEESLVDTSYLLANVLSNNIANAEALGAALRDINNEKLQAQIYGLEKAAVDLRISVTDTAGRVLFDSYEPKNIGTDFSTWRNVALTLQGKYGARTTRDNPKDPTSTVLYVSAPIKRGGELLGVLTVAKPTSSANSFIDSARGRLLKGSLSLLIFMLVFAALLIHYLARPIDKLTEYAHAVRDGKQAAFPKLASSDIARLGRAFEEMKVSLEGKRYIERYIQTLTHELKSPLAGIRGSAELLSEPSLPDEKRQIFLKNILGETNRINLLVERLLELSALETRGSESSLEPVNFTEVMERVREAMLPRIEKKKLRLELHARAVSELIGNGFLLEHALTNLFDNAIDFSPPGGVLTCTLEECSKDGKVGLEYVLTDDGPGIPEFAREKIMDRFFSLPRPDSGRKSSGLGLSIVSEVVKLHHGSFSIENRRTSRGTEARLWLPYAFADS